MVENGLVLTVRALTYQPPDASSAAVEVQSFARLRQLDDGHTQRGDFHVLVFVDAGSGQVTIDFRTFALGPRTAVWISPGAVHRWDDIADVCGDVVLFVPTAPVTPATRQLAARPHTAPCWTVPDTRWAHVDAARAHLRLEVGDPTSGSAPELPQILLSALIASLDPPETVQLTGGRTYEQFRASVEAHFRTHHDVGFYARDLGYATRTLTRAVQQSTGGTAKAYLVERIVLEAKRLLVHDRLPAARVAAELGFPDASNFSLFFRNAAGMPPGAWQATATATPSAQCG